jgi:hypothetical protein
MDASIILQGQSPDIVNALARANDAAQARLTYDRQNAMNAMLKEQGAGILAGDQNALNALAGYDPQAALGVQSARLGMDATRQQMSISAERLAMEKAEGKRMAEEALRAQAEKMTAEQLAAEQKQIEAGLSGAAAFYQKGDKAGYDAWLAKNGMDPAEYSFEEFPAHAAMFEGVLEAFQTFAPPQTGDRYKVVGGSLVDLQADGGPAIVAEGAMQETMVMGPDGKPIMVQGGKGTAAKFTEAQSKDNVFATRAEGALAALEGPSDPNDPNAPPLADALADFKQNASERVPLVGNYLLSDTFQTARTAGDEFLQAILRKDTGAAITAPEQALYGVTYLPQPGDGPRRLAYKKEARARAVEAIKAGMNPQQVEAMARADAAVVERLGEDGQPAAQGAKTKAGPTVVDGYKIEVIE